MSIEEAIITQINKSNYNYQNRKKVKEANTKIEAIKKAEENQSLLRKKEAIFNQQRYLIENSGVRTVLEIIIKGLNKSREYYHKYFPLKEKILKMINSDCLFPAYYSTKYSISKPYLFNSSENCHQDENYYIFLQCRDFPHHVHHFFVHFSSNDSKLFLHLNFQNSGNKQYDKTVELSSDSELG